MSYRDYMRSSLRDDLAALGMEPCELCGSCGRHLSDICRACRGVGAVKISAQSRREYELAQVTAKQSERV